MKLWKIVLFAITVSVASCSIQKKPQLQITHVLAVTQQGDTLTIPIDVIRPINYRIINYSTPWNYGYNLNNWYHGGRVYHYDYSHSSSGRSSNNSSSNAGSSKNNYGQSPNPKSVPLSKAENIKEPRK